MLVGGKIATFFIIHFMRIWIVRVTCMRRVLLLICPCSLLYKFLFSRAVLDLLMCNVGPHKIVQEDIKMVVHRELLTSTHA